MRETLQNYHLSTDLATQEELDNAISSMNSISSDILDGLSNVINGKLSAIADLVEEETKKLDELSTKVDSGSGGGGSSISDYISAITINGTTKTPVDKVIDLGAISSYVSDLSTVYAPYARKVKVNDNTSLKGTLDLTFNTDHFTVIWDDDEPEPGTPESYDTAGTIHLNTEYLDEQYAKLSAHNNLVSSYTALESRVLSTENLIGDILSVLQTINGTNGGESGGGETYTGFVPEGDPLYYSVTNESGNPISVRRQIQGPPYSWFQTATEGQNYSDNGTFKFEIDGTGHIVVTIDSNIESIYTTCPWTYGDVVAKIDQSTFIPTSVNGSFEWLETL